MLGSSGRSKELSCRPASRCSGCGGTKTSRRKQDILDVWFDSGVSFAAVLERRDELGGHRGPLPRGQRSASRLVPDVAPDLGRDARPRALSSGADARLHPRRGRPEDVEVGRQRDRAAGHRREHGADILRLWVAAEDYRDDVRISQEILGRAIEAYRRIRNTARFLLGNLSDFDPAARRGVGPRRNCSSSIASILDAPAGAGRALPKGVRRLRVSRRLSRAQQLLQRRSCARSTSTS